MKKSIKAVGLFSGGLDSVVAACLMKSLGIEVHAICFSMPWGCGHPEWAEKQAKLIGIPLTVKNLAHEFLEIVKSPQYGTGASINPCVDCKIFMLKNAGQFMNEIGADFVYTGEVLGQRPMSQVKPKLLLIEKKSGLEGKLLRPLCAQLLEETEIEKSNLIDRNKLLAISGRSRRMQMDLAKKFGIEKFAQPAGGCLLTDKNFGNRMKDLFQYGYRDLNDVINLCWGRHFRLNSEYKCILGRNEEENRLLIKEANSQDIIMTFDDEMGPESVIKGDGKKCPKEILITTAGLIKNFSKFKDRTSIKMRYWQVSTSFEVKFIEPRTISDVELKQIWL